MRPCHQDALHVWLWVMSTSASSAPAHIDSGLQQPCLLLKGVWLSFIMHLVCTLLDSAGWYPCQSTKAGGQLASILFDGVVQWGAEQEGTCLLPQHGCWQYNRGWESCNCLAAWRGVHVETCPIHPRLASSCPVQLKQAAACRMIQIKCITLCCFYLFSPL